MKCGYSKEILALYIEDDLPSLEAVRTVDAHVVACTECRQYCEQLRRSQAFIKSRFRPLHPDVVSQDVLTAMRRNVMSEIEPARQSLGWALRLERFLVLALKRPHFAAAGFAIVAIVSATLLGQIQYSVQRIDPAAVFAANNALFRPADYRDWVFAGSYLGHRPFPDESAAVKHNVYIDPAAYREYARLGRFPEGAVMVLESSGKDFAGLEVSVKDSSRFDGGWGFYDFTEGNGQLKPEAAVLPESEGCLSCHRDGGETDHVFTQFYPALRLGAAKL